MRNSSTVSSPETSVGEVDEFLGADAGVPVAEQDGLLDPGEGSTLTFLRHHPASEALAHTAAPALIDIPHWAAEWTWLPVVQGPVAEAVGSVAWEISMINTDPWTFWV